ncbi:hypothetical protein [Nonomuraea sp. B19D2]|uniref:hypothetical protein n=1 Tax=Nonomuraea sp. B19D2 TaxID=3159561 RepID=UPI0032DAE936
MRVYRTKHESNYTVLPNAMLQRDDLSFAALGILAFLLSQPDGKAMTVAKLERIRKEGKAVVRAAVAELRAAGYYIKEDRQGVDGQLRGANAVYDIPQNGAFSQVEPTAEIPPVEIPAVNPVKEPSRKETSPLPPIEAASVAESAPEAPKGGGEGDLPTQDEIAACAPLVARIGRLEPRLTIGLSEMGKVLPLVAEWRQRGASDDQIIHAVTAGLPGNVDTAVGLMRSRLTRKMPARFTVTSVTPAHAMYECPECGRPGRQAGRCADCRTVSTPETADTVEVSGNPVAADLRRRMGWRIAS